LEELVHLLSDLRLVLERQASPPVSRLALRIDELADALGISRRAIERERAAGRFPAPDLTIGKMPLWRVSTIEAWLAQQANGRRVRG
jgi:predicted DNA-binding transcriptional regulator AlpA